MPLLYTIGRYTVAPAIRMAWRPTVEGLEHLPETGGAVLAGNHLSVADEYMMGAVVPAAYRVLGEGGVLQRHRRERLGVQDRS